ncbi:MAG: response regulator [Actinobacteria bacterium]|nr:MAG: response regulator [Actinomycetota bacterium]
MPRRSRNEVLVVDDDPVLCSVLCDVFEHEGYTVRWAAGGEQALAALDQLVPDCMILAPRTRVVVLTAQDERRHVLRCFELGVFKFATKPIDPSILFLAVDKLLHMSNDEADRERREELEMARRLAQLDAALDEIRARGIGRG